MATEKLETVPYPVRGGALLTTTVLPLPVLYTHMLNIYVRCMKIKITTSMHMHDLKDLRNLV
jgi:hypothetical protein